MQARRLIENNRTLFDYRDLLDKRKWRGKSLLRYNGKAQSFETEEGVRFFKEHPFQWVPTEEAQYLLDNPTPYTSFVEATVEQVEDYYAL